MQHRSVRPIAAQGPYYAFAPTGPKSGVAVAVSVNADDGLPSQAKVLCITCLRAHAQTMCLDMAHRISNSSSFSIACPRLCAMR